MVGGEDPFIVELTKLFMHCINGRLSVYFNAGSSRHLCEHKSCDDLLGGGGWDGVCGELLL